MAGRSPSMSPSPSVNRSRLRVGSFDSAMDLGGGAALRNKETCCDKIRSYLQFLGFLPTFALYVFFSTVLSLVFNLVRGGRFFARFFVAIYAFTRLVIGLCLLVTFRVARWFIESMFIALDCLLRTKRESHLMEKYKKANSYEEWYEIGSQLDRVIPTIQEWKNTSASADYDYELLKSQLTLMKKALRKQDLTAVKQACGNVFRRGYCSLHNNHLYQHSHTGTKKTIEDYYDTLTKCIDFITKHPDPSLSTADRIDFLFRGKRSMGRTGLCLSGGGALAMAHVGVIRALVRCNCLPKVISGTSGGAIIAGFIAQFTDEELKDNMDDLLGVDISTRHGVRFLPTYYQQLNSVYRSSVLMEAEEFIHSIKKYVGDMTFKEAWAKSGRHVSITVSYSTKNKDNKLHAHSILLNHITSPDTYLWSAVCASCALPMLMSPQKLLSKSPDGPVPFYPDGVEWVDGSLQQDIPIQPLQELFRVNYSIVSQLNPHVTPFILEPTDDSSLMTHQHKNLRQRTNRNFGLNILEMLDDLANQTVNHQLDRLARFKFIPKVYGQAFDRFARQKFTGDVTIVGKFPLTMRLKLLTHPTINDMREYITIGEKATWPHLEHIRNMLRIESIFDDCIIDLKIRHAADSGSNSISPKNNHTHSVPLSGGMMSDDSDDTDGQSTKIAKGAARRRLDGNGKQYDSSWDLRVGMDQL